uniref:Acidic protein n=1 Tax=Hordeum vulgare subsp. vulgare TaxID=112509 RepID=A0A8I6YPU7_HORVV
METKMSRAIAIAALCVLLLVLPGQVAAESKFCECYDDCYRQCRHHILRFACVPFCTNKCSPNQAAAAAAGGDRDRCRDACAKVKICGQSDPSDNECDRGCY